LFHMKSILLYGPENSSKYKKAMELILPYSRSGLKYKRKIEITLNGDIYYYNISDVHFEIDFELLGTNEHGLWYEFMNQITTIVQTMELGIVLCRNFHMIDTELLILFHTFMRNPKIHFILCTRHISFIPRHVKEICQIYTLKKEGNELYGNEYKTYCDKIVSEFIPHWYSGSEKRELAKKICTLFENYAHYTEKFNESYEYFNNHKNMKPVLGAKLRGYPTKEDIESSFTNSINNLEKYMNALAQEELYTKELEKQLRPETDASVVV